jgi:hypothetical protein
VRSDRRTRYRGAGPFNLVLLIATVAAVGGLALGTARAGAQDVAVGHPDRFNADLACRSVKLQLSYGQRPAGSPQLRRLATRLRGMLPHGRFEPVAGSRLRNIVGILPGRRPGMVIGAHYDVLARPTGFIGANNGAAGTGVVIELARAMGRARRPAGSPELRFVLFDGEEPAEGTPEEASDFYAAGLRGSKAYVAAHPRGASAMVLLDYVGNRGLRLPREASSSPALWRELRAAARAVGMGSVFPDATQTEILDNHTPFLRAGVPAIDLIDWRYPGHDLSDTLDKLSPRSLDAVGESVLELLLRRDARR